MRKCDLIFCKNLKTADADDSIIASIFEDGSYSLTKEFYQIDLFSKEIIEIFLKKCSTSKNPIDFAVKNTGQPFTSIYIDNISNL